MVSSLQKHQVVCTNSNLIINDIWVNILSYCTDESLYKFLQCSNKFGDLIKHIDWKERFHKRFLNIEKKVVKDYFILYRRRKLEIYDVISSSTETIKNEYNHYYHFLKNVFFSFEELKELKIMDNKLYNKIVITSNSKEIINEHKIYKNIFKNKTKTSHEFYQIFLLFVNF
jgi:hypothetical protein